MFIYVKNAQEINTYVKEHNLHMVYECTKKKLLNLESNKTTL